MTWQAGAVLNGVIAAAYLAIAWTILRGLRRAGQIRTNRLALATSAIFVTCAVHHGGHSLHMIAPLFGVDLDHGLAFRRAVTWQMDVWDAVGAAVAVFYLSLRRSYGKLLDGPEMFDNLERRRYEERLERERASLAEAQAVAQLGSWEIDLASGTRTWSAQMYAVLGVPPDTELEEAVLLGLPHPDDRARIAAAVAEACELGTGFEITFRRELTGGAIRYLREVGRVVCDADGRRVRLVGTTQDITDVTLAELARTEAEEKLRVTAEHAPIGVALVDLSADRRGRLLNANVALARIFGHPIDALEEMALSSLVHPDETRRLAAELLRLAEEPHTRIELELRALHADGHVLWIQLTGGTVPAGPHERSGVLHLMDIGERKRFEGQLQHLADHDALTGLFNRRRFEEELQRVLAEAERYGRRGAVLLLDLDGFKFVNDSLGHSVGDELVTRVGGLLRNALRDTDVIGRLGGDEFAIILGDTDEPDARSVADKLLDVCRERAILVGRQHRARVTASIGITLFAAGTDGGSLSAEELIVEADIAMYEAKEAGKDRACVYAREQSERIMQRQSWLERLRQASAEGRFELFAQPIVGICAGGTNRFELLLRLRGDDDELIPPGTFLYNAERFELIQQIDRWVFAEAVQILHRHAGDDLCLSVNLSGRTLTDRNLLADFSRELTEHPIDPGRLIVEVTETAAIVNIDRAREVARGLRELGCRFALDDFGAGFASFYYLKHLDFDFLKIDGEFIKSLPANATDRLVVRSVVDIARQLGAETIAEFVGDDETVAMLRELGVGYGQGYHLGRPGPVATVLPATVVA